MDKFEQSFPKETEDPCELFARFMEELCRWSQSGVEPSSGDQDIRYLLELQRKRFMDHHLHPAFSYEEKLPVQSIAQVEESYAITGNFGFSRFHRRTCFQPMVKKLALDREGQKTKIITKPCICYMTIMEAPANLIEVGKKPYCCPNCGAISPVEILEQRGCPYCQTRFMMRDLFPKVCNYYFLEDYSDLDHQKISLKAFVILAAGIALFGGVIANFIHMQSETVSVGSWIFTILMYPFFAAILGYIVYSIYILFRLGKGSARAIKVAGGSKQQAGQITGYLKQFDSSFSYEYFESKALSLARISLLHDDLRNCPQYVGQEADPNREDILDIDYRGGMKVYSIQPEAGFMVAKVGLYASVIMDRDAKIRESDQLIQMTLTHRLGLPVDPDFSIKKVTCPHCGGSFDASRQRICPYCSGLYQVENFDWVVNDIRITS